MQSLWKGSIKMGMTFSTKGLLSTLILEPLSLNFIKEMPPAKPVGIFFIREKRNF